MNDQMLIMLNSYLDTSDSIVALQGHAPAAAYWIILCGKRLHDESDAVKA